MNEDGHLRRKKTVMSTYILIYGFQHGGWCWKKVVPLLEAQGHTVIAHDLPAHGQDQTPLSEVTATSYVDSVLSLIDKQAEPVILVGHSMGGITISQVAELRPDAVLKLVYLAAFLLPDGVNLMDALTEDTESLAWKYVVYNVERTASLLTAQGAKEAFYYDCSADDLAFALQNLVPEPLSAIPETLHLTEENFGSVQRIYIETLQDQALGPLMQKKMYMALPCERVFSLNTGHSPFFSIPQELANCLSML